MVTKMVFLTSLIKILKPQKVLLLMVLVLLWIQMVMVSQIAKTKIHFLLLALL